MSTSPRPASARQRPRPEIRASRRDRHQGAQSRDRGPFSWGIGGIRTQPDPGAAPKRASPPRGALVAREPSTETDGRRHRGRQGDAHQSRHRRDANRAPPRRLSLDALPVYPRRANREYPRRLRTNGSSRPFPDIRLVIYGRESWQVDATSALYFSVLPHPKNVFPVLITLPIRSLYAVGLTDTKNHSTEKPRTDFIASVSGFCHQPTTRIMKGAKAIAAQLSIPRNRVNRLSDGKSARLNSAYSSRSKSPVAAISSSLPSVRARNSRVSGRGVANQAILLRRAAPAVRKRS
jgi:hypothetical protein